MTPYPVIASTLLSFVAIAISVSSLVIRTDVDSDFKSHVIDTNVHGDIISSSMFDLAGKWDCRGSFAYINTANSNLTDFEKTPTIVEVESSELKIAQFAKGTFTFSSTDFNSASLCRMFSTYKFACAEHSSYNGELTDTSIGKVVDRNNIALQVLALGERPGPNSVVGKPRIYSASCKRK